MPLPGACSRFRHCFLKGDCGRECIYGAGDRVGHPNSNVAATASAANSVQNSFFVLRGRVGRERYFRTESVSLCLLVAAPPHACPISLTRSARPLCQGQKPCLLRECGPRRPQYKCVFCTDYVSRRYAPALKRHLALPTSGAAPTAYPFLQYSL
jgi:hypothetical protein